MFECAALFAAVNVNSCVVLLSFVMCVVSAAIDRCGVSLSVAVVAVIRVRCRPLVSSVVACRC